LKLKYDETLSNFAFHLKLRRYSKVCTLPKKQRVHDVREAAGLVQARPHQPRHFYF
jgi:hypothetical protein